jgi:hypothetical protein
MHLIEKILIVICLENSATNLNEFIFILVFLFQIISLFFSLYIFYFKSFYIMNNIFLSKARIAFISSTVLINIILILLGNNSSRGNNFVVVIINVIIISFIVTQVFYNPYKYVFFDNNENIENFISIFI